MLKCTYWDCAKVYVLGLALPQRSVYAYFNFFCAFNFHSSSAPIKVFYQQNFPKKTNIQYVALSPDFLSHTCLITTVSTYLTLVSCPAGNNLWKVRLVMLGLILGLLYLRRSYLDMPNQIAVCPIPGVAHWYPSACGDANW